MVSSAYLRLNIPTSYSQRSSQFCYLKFNHKHNRVDLGSNRQGEGYLLKAINDHGPVEPARIVLERLFEHAQTLEEQMANEPRLTQDIQLALNLSVLESDLQAALTALKKEEEHLKEAQRMVLLENSRLNHTKELLERQEKEIAAACSKCEKLEDELKAANHNLASQARHIEDLKFLARERDQEFAVAVFRLSLKESKMAEMRETLAEKAQKVADIGSKFTLSAQHLTEANEALKQHKIELQEFWKAIQKKEWQLNFFRTLRKLKEKLEIEEANFKKLAMRWLEFEQDLLKEKELMEELQEEIRREKSSLLHVLHEDGSLRELKAKKIEFGETTAALLVKESELAELKLKIHHLKSEEASVQLALEEQELKLSNARKNLDHVNQEISDLKMLINSRERQLIQAISMLQEHDESVAMHTMQNESDYTDLPVSEAESPVERILELLNKLMSIIKDEISA